MYCKTNIDINQNHHQYCHKEIDIKKLLFLFEKSLLNWSILNWLKKRFLYIIYNISKIFFGVLKKANFSNQKFIKKNIKDCKKKEKKKSDNSKVNLKKFKKKFSKTKKLFKKKNSVKA